MAEGRMLKKEISDSKKLGRLPSDRPRVLYFMMLPHLDVKGRLYADPQKIKGQIVTMLPYSAAAIQKALEQLHEVGLIVLYQINSDQYLEYTRFYDFQSLNPKREAESKISAPTPEDSGGLKRTPCKVKLSKVKLSKVKEKHLTFVFLTKDEYKKLVQVYGEKVVGSLIEDLDDYIGNNKKGRNPYSSHYRTIRQWAKRDKKEEQTTHKAKLFPIAGRICSVSGCKLPAVYKDSSSAYDSFKCAKHLPDEVKEMYC